MAKSQKDRKSCLLVSFLVFTRRKVRSFKGEVDGSLTRVTLVQEAIRVGVYSPKVFFFIHFLSGLDLFLIFVYFLLLSCHFSNKNM